MMRLLARAILLAAAMALATILLGWWSVPLLGAAWGWLERGGPRPIATAALAAALGWAALLLWDGARGPVASFGATLGGVVHAPAWALLLLTVAYAAALAAAAASVTRGLGAPRVIDR
jgi:hypothetical protein